MSERLWSEVDAYIEDRLLGADEVLEEAVRASAEGGLPQIAVSPAQGKLLHLLARIHGARRVLEVGTLGGYSSIWLGRAIALAGEGRLISLELDPHYADVARGNIERAGLGALVEVQVGPAIDSLDRLVREGGERFEMVFIDADKQSTPAYFERALELVGSGAVIVVDNVVRDGELIDTNSGDPRVEGMRRFHELLGSQKGVTGTTIQTVGSKGYDGFTLALVQ